MTWRDDAACREADPRDFDATDWPTHLLARAICATCPVVADCWAEADRQLRSSGYAPRGTWGGRLIGKKGTQVTRKEEAA